MPLQIGESSVAAATAVVDYDLLRDKNWKRSSAPRVIQGLGLCGSGAAGDTLVEVLVNSDLVAELYNRATGFATRDHVLPVSVIVPAGAELVARVKDAPVTSPINLLVLFAP